MEDIKVFDIANEVIEEATSQFSPIWSINSDKLDILHQYCDLIDLLSKETEAEGYSVDVDDTNMLINIGVICYDFSISRNFKVFNELMSRSVSFLVSEDEESEDMIVARFTFPSVWDRM